MPEPRRSRSCRRRSRTCGKNAGRPYLSGSGSGFCRRHQKAAGHNKRKSSGPLSWGRRTMAAGGLPDGRRFRFLQAVPFFRYYQYEQRFPYPAVFLCRVFDRVSRRCGRGYGRTLPAVPAASRCAESGTSRFGNILFSLFPAPSSSSLRHHFRGGAKPIRASVSGCAGTLAKSRNRNITHRPFGGNQTRF